MTDIIKVWEERVEEQKLYRKLEKEAHEKECGKLIEENANYTFDKLAKRSKDVRKQMQAQKEKFVEHIKWLKKEFASVGWRLDEEELRAHLDYILEKLADSNTKTKVVE